MDYVFELNDKRGRIVNLTKSAWAHIRIEHSNIENPEEIIKSITNPNKIIQDERENVEYFFKYFKHKNQKSKFLKVVVKYINNKGNILSAHFVRHIQ